MSFNLFHFASPAWLYALLFIPALWLIIGLRSRLKPQSKAINEFADAHLIPHLLVREETGVKRRSLIIAGCSVAWMLGAVALANPEWDFHLVKTFQPDRSVVVVLDLSNAMNVTDVKPSRLEVAKEKIQDLLDDSNGLSVGLVAFAEDAHMVTPITDDKRALRALVPALSTDIVYAKGSRLTSALQMAGDLLKPMPGHKKSVLVMSAGQFEDPSAISLATDLAREGIHVDVMGFGPSSVLRELSRLGGGTYSTASSPIQTIGSLQDSLVSRSGASFTTQSSEKTTKDWEPRFYVFLIPLMLLLAPLFRRTKMKGAATLMVLFVCFAVNSHASTTDELFKNKEMLGRELLNTKHYDQAISKFTDPYRRGVAQYRAGDFASAATSFASSTRPEVELDAKYNLGNALAKQGKLQDAADAYRAVLKTEPTHVRAQENLKIVMDLLKKQESKDQPQKNAQNQKQDQKKDQKQDQANESQSKSDQPKQSPSNKAEAQQGQDKPDKQAQDKGSQKQAQNQNEKQDGKPGTEQSQSASRSQKEKSKTGQDKPANDSESTSANEAHKRDDQSYEKKDASSEDGNDPRHESSASESQQNSPRLASAVQKDVDADQWLNRVTSRPQNFLKNQFMIESTRLGTKGAQQ